MSTDSGKQIKQMVNFIIQEAHEKVNEIKIKTEHDFTLERQNLVHAGKLKVQEEYAQKEKDLEIQQRVSRSAAVSLARVKKMKVRDDLLEVLKKEVTEKLASYCKGPDYPALIGKLIVQGLIKIQEQVVEIQSRAEDRAIVARVLPDAIASYRSLMASAGHTVDPRVTLSDLNLSSKTSSGGIVLTALNARIILSQTVDDRLLIAYQDIMPQVRQGLFTSSA